MSPERVRNGPIAGRLTEHEQALAELARRHAVCYEVWPDRLIVEGQSRQVGFDLEFLGVNEAHDHAQAPGCPRCVETYEDLRRIAEWLLPEPGRPTRCDIAPFEAAWHASPSREFRLEVALRVRIGHRHGSERPADDFEVRCLAEMEERLARLGIERGRSRGGRHGNGG